MPCRVKSVPMLMATLLVAGVVVVDCFAGDRIPISALLELDRGDAFTFEADDIAEACDHYLSPGKIIAPAVKSKLLWWRMRSRIRQGRSEDAIADAKLYLDLVPNDLQVAVLRARLLLLEKEMELALTESKSLVALYPDSAAAHAQLAHVHMFEMKFDQADEELAKALSIDPGDALLNHVSAARAYLNNDIAGAIEFTNKYIEADSLYGLQLAEWKFLERGELHRRNGDFNNAIRDFQVAQKLRPDHIQAKVAILSLYFEQKKMNLCLSIAETLAQRSKDELLAHACYGDVLCTFGRFDEAFDAYMKCLELGGGKLDTTFALIASVAAKADKFGKSAELVREGLEIIPESNLLFRFNLNYLSACPDPAYRDGPAAVKLATKECERTNWKDAWALLDLSGAEAECGNFEVAIDLCRRAKELQSPEDAMVEANNREQSFLNKKPMRIAKTDTFFPIVPIGIIVYND